MLNDNQYHECLKKLNIHEDIDKEYVYNLKDNGDNKSIYNRTTTKINCNNINININLNQQIESSSQNYISFLIRKLWNILICLK